MTDFSIVIGGKAGFGIDKSGNIIGRILNNLGLRIYIYRDYPSLIRGGHTFSVIRVSEKLISTHQEKIDFLLALNQDTINFHKDRLQENSVVIYDSDTVKIEGLNPSIKTQGIPVAKIVKEENGSEIMRNTCLIGAFLKAVGVSWDLLAEIFNKEFAQDAELNLKVARRGFDQAEESIKIEPKNQIKFPLLSGNQAVALGLIKAGLKNYISYPMTPTSPILHFLAEIGHEFSLKVIHPESEIGVILMALGFAYAGEKTAVGTSGGGFCLMTEGVSLAGMAELPVVVVVGQRPGPSTGLPTYSAQTDLNFVLSAGHGEFARFVVAPGDVQDAYFWSAISLNFSWKYQTPAFVLTDKNLGESTFNFDLDSVGQIKEEEPLVWDGVLPYKRYLDTKDGVSPLAFVADKDAVVKVNSYEHDESGITTEDASQTTQMQDKRLRKIKFMIEDLASFDTVKVYGNKKSSTAILCWGSNKGVCVELAQEFGLRVIQPIVLCPFGVQHFEDAAQGVTKLINVENNASAQLGKMVENLGYEIAADILKYDGRPFTVEELREKLKKVL